MSARDTRKRARTQDRDSGRRDRLALTGASLLVSGNLCLFGPFEIYSSNRAKFDIALGDALPILIGLCLLVATALALLGLLVPRQARHRVTSVLLALGVLLWVQGSFLRWGYGEFKGVAIDWGAYPWQGWVDAVIWVAVLSAAVYLSRRISQRALFLVIVFILVQSTAMVARTVTNRDNTAMQRSREAREKEESGSVIPEALCQLSTSRNVFHFIFDALQTDVFMELVEEERLTETLDGFVVYPDNMSTGSITVLSIPAVFSTNIYDGKEAESEYFRNAMDASFTGVLARRGYVVNLMPHVAMNGAMHTNYFWRRGTYAEGFRTRLLRMSTYLIDLGLFRQSPHFLKRAVYNDQNFRLSGLVGDPPTHSSFHHKAMFRDYIRRIEAVHEGPAYHFMHLMPPHPPFVTRADGSYAGEVLPHTRENYKNEARHVIRLFLRFIDKLKKLGLYDSSVILLHGDHGLGSTDEDDVSGMEKRMNWLSALLVLKTAGRHGELSSSNAKTSLTDIPATLLGLLGIRHSFPGESITGLDPSASRSRSAVFVTGRTTNDPVVHPWVVTGSVRDSVSWHEMTPREVERRIAHYEWGERINFGIAEEGGAYLTSGWSTTAALYAWNDGKSAQMTFAVEKPQRDVVVRVLVFPYVVPGKVDRQRIEISINGEPRGMVVCDSPRPVSIQEVVRRSLLQDGQLVLSFKFPDAVSPRDIGDGNDQRAFAVKLYRFEAVYAPETRR